MFSSNIFKKNSGRFCSVMRVYDAGMSYRLLLMLCVQLRLWREICWGLYQTLKYETFNLKPKSVPHYPIDEDWTDFFITTYSKTNWETCYPCRLSLYWPLAICDDFCLVTQISERDWAQAMHLWETGYNVKYSEYNLRANLFCGRKIVHNLNQFCTYLARYLIEVFFVG